MDQVNCPSLYEFGARACEMCRAISDSLVDLLDATICEPCLRRIDADPREKRALLLSASQPLEW